MSAVRRESDRACGPGLSFFAPWRAFCGLLILAMLLASRYSAAADPPVDLAAEIAAHVEAREFAPALKLALSAQGTKRDRLLAMIAVGQAEAGARNEFADTLDQIGDEMVRMQAARDGRVEIMAQVFVPQPGQGPGGQLPGGQPGQNQGNNGNLFGQVGQGGLQGGNEADFDPIMELITTTIAPPSWDVVGGPGSLKPFPSGVLVDVNGLMRRLRGRETADGGDALARAKKLAAAPAEVAAGSPRRSSSLRMVSLPRLERFLLRELAAGRPLDESVLVLAGLAKVEYVLIFPSSGDIVLAGPAGDWRRDAGGRMVAVETGRPVLRLDDLVTVLRQVALDEGAAFGCSIVPRQAGLAAAQEFATESAKTPLKPKDRDAWLETLRSRLGRQDIEFYGLSTASHAARVLIEADYHMKLLGIGLAESTPAAASYLDRIEQAGGAPEALDVLRWWFTLNYDALVASDDQLGFELRGPAVQVLSESELLARDGRRIHTGRSERFNREFAHGFTADFAALSAKYPVYAELANVFDLAVAAAVIRHAKALDQVDRQQVDRQQVDRQQVDRQQVDWQFGCLADDEVLPLPRTFVPREVDTVATCRVFNKRQIVAVVSGGVRVDPDRMIDELGFSEDGQGRVSEVRAAAHPGEADAKAWWWDADPARLAAER